MQRRKGQRKKKRTASICNRTGNILLVIVILLCIPLTLPRIFGLTVYTVVSGSMEPAIPVGSLVYVKEVEAAEIQEGEIIAFYSASDSGAVITHRVVKNQIVSGKFITKGDANETEDAMPIDYNLLVGKVVLRVPVLGKILSILVTPIGKIGAACAVMLGVVLHIIAGKENIHALSHQKSWLWISVRMLFSFYSNYFCCCFVQRLCREWKSILRKKYKRCDSFGFNAGSVRKNNLRGRMRFRRRFEYFRGIHYDELYRNQ